MEETERESVCLTKVETLFYTPTPTLICAHPHVHTHHTLGDTNYKTSRIDRSKGGKRKSTHLLLDNRDDKENQPSNKERGLVSKSECPSTDLNELDSSEEGDTIMAKSVSLSNVSMTEQLLSEE